MKLNYILLSAILLISIVFMSSCTQQTETPLETDQEQTIQPSDKVTDKGDFKVMYDSIESPDFIELEKVFKESRLFEEVTNELNDNIALPHDITIVFGECGEANAFYDSENNQIVMCYELITYISESFVDEVETEEELGIAIIHTLLFLFYHELGHTLIDIYKLPITGKEEDAVDQLSTVVLAEAGEGGENATLNGAVWFFINSENTQLSESAFADEHSFDRQRSYNMMCWIYGKNPEKYSYLVDEDYLPKERSEGCEGEYFQMSNSWDRLLSPYLK